MSLTESSLHPETAAFRHVIPAGEPYLFEVKAGQTLRLLDLEGNQAVDTLFFSAKNPRERYDPQRTLRRQNRVYLTTGTVLYSNLGNPLLTITADTCGRHDTLGGACAQESNVVRYALDKRYMHSCRDNFLRASLHDGRLSKRDIGANIWGFRKSQAEYRVYVTDAAGTVVFDSAGRDLGRDYSRWNDVLLTLRGQYGARSTRSDPDDDSTSVMHVAAPIRDGRRIVAC